MFVLSTLSHVMSPLSDLPLSLFPVARTHSSHERNIDVFIFRHFGHRTFLADPSRPRTRIPAYDILSVFPSNDAVKWPVTSMLEIPKHVYGEYAECIKRHQNRVAHVWGAMPMRVSLR